MLRKAYRYLYLILFLFTNVSAFSQQQKWPSTLLWRISGNDLTKPSYLYGTMHLQDKRLFQFGDSLYKALENTEGMAIEVDFKEYLDSIMHNSLKRLEKEALLEKQEVKLDRKKLDKSADSLLKKFGIKGNTLTKKDLKK